MEVLRGRDGRDGSNGRDGVNGVKGEQGEIGLPGSPGAMGDPGVQGIVGPRGPVGEKGMRGVPGMPGEKGMHGVPGPSGVSGERGEKGMRGDPCLRGLQGEQGPQGPATGGVIYTRWGRTNCPTDQGTQLLYAGRAGGTRHDHKGGAANYLCMPDDPDHLQYQSGVQGYSSITGVEYEYYSLPSLSSYNNHNVPCAVCYVANRSVSVMIPAKTHCPTHWTLEYIGFLMSGHYIFHSRKMYECVDKDPESVPGLDSSSNPRALFYLVEPYCNGLSCPPYEAEKELTCVVCTR